MAEIALTDTARELFADGIDARVTNGGEAKITVEQCAEWRQRVRRHARYSHIADDENVSTTTVSQHVRDECSHEVDEPAVSDGGDR